MSMRILVVEDHEDNRQILRDLLGAAGYGMIEALPDGSAPMRLNASVLDTMSAAPAEARPAQKGKRVSERPSRLMSVSAGYERCPIGRLSRPNLRTPDRDQI